MRAGGRKKRQVKASRCEEGDHGGEQASLLGAEAVLAQELGRDASEHVDDAQLRLGPTRPRDMFVVGADRAGLGARLLRQEVRHGRYPVAPDMPVA